MTNNLKILALWWLVMGVAAMSHAVQIVTNDANLVCREIPLFKEVRVFRDPSLFVEDAPQVGAEGKGSGWDKLSVSGPLITTLSGKVSIMLLGQGPFPKFGRLEEMYGAVEPSLKNRRPGTISVTSPDITHVRLCDSGYTDTLGFVITSELEAARTEDGETFHLPPSTVGNQIPTLPEHLVVGSQAGKPIQP